MFEFNKLKQIHLEITNNCQASCPMCSRNINSGLDNPLIKNNSWSLTDFQTVMSQEVLDQLDGFYFCGNFGDPILNNDLIEMCEYATKCAPHLNIRVHSNGSARNTEWWKRLAKALPKQHNIIFALDGLEDTHHIYRVGTNFNTILENARAVIEEGAIAEWVFIKFKHNEHQVEDARALAQKLGFKTFTVKNSSRFMLDSKHPVVDRQGRTVYYLEPATENKMTFITKSDVENYKDIVDSMEIDCLAKSSKEIYIDAYKNVFPCCWLASTPYNYISNDAASVVRNQMKVQYDDLRNTLGNINAVEVSIKDIINSDVWQTCWDRYWTDDKLITCARSCGRSKSVFFAQPRDQQTNRDVL